jgi:hypothetical protein
VKINYLMMVFLTSNKRGTVALESDRMGSVQFLPCEVKVENKHTTLLGASKDIGIEKYVNINAMWRLCRSKLHPRDGH